MKQIIKLWKYGLIILSVSLLFINHSKAKKPLSINDDAPNILLKDLDPKLFNFKKYEIKNYILISFSATFCKPCKTEIKEFQKLLKTIGTNRLTIYLVFIDKDISDIKKYIKENNIKLPVLHDKYKIVSNKYEVTGLPTSFLINKSRKIKYIAKGYSRGNIKKIKKIITD